MHMETINAWKIQRSIRCISHVKQRMQLFWHTWCYFWGRFACTLESLETTWAKKSCVGFILSFFVRFILQRKSPFSSNSFQSCFCRSTQHFNFLYHIHRSILFFSRVGICGGAEIGQNDWKFISFEPILSNYETKNNWSHFWRQINFVP